MKAQIWAIDFATSVIIFAIGIVVVLFAFNGLADSTGQELESSRMQDRALEVTESFVRTAGLPLGWTSSDVTAIGLAQEYNETDASTGVRENVLDSSKVLAFVSPNLDYNKSKAIMDISNYEYYFWMEHINGTQVSLQGVDIVKGTNFASARNVVIVERHVILSEVIMKLELVLGQ